MADPIAAAILRTLQYADIFDYPLTRDELQRYLIGLRVSRAEIEAALNDPARVNGSVARVGGYLMLPHRQCIVDERIRLHQDAQTQMPRMSFYAHLLACMPFVRMVALTGALAMENARDGDIDFLVVSAPGRLWTVRALAVALVRIARRFGDHLCPNFLLAENALEIRPSLYSAHEIVQMHPLYGLDVYCRMRQVNAWVERFLPNADEINSRGREHALHPAGLFFKRATERVLSGTFGERIELWEMARKIKKLSAQVPANADDVEFSRDACRGFFSGHGRHVAEEYERRTSIL